MANVASIDIQFVTTSDDKDWDTQILDRLVIKNEDAATLQCCSADHDDDNFKNGSTKVRRMALRRPINRSELSGATVVFGQLPVGRDTWIFIPTLIVTYDDGTPNDQWTFPEILLTSDNSYSSHEVTIP